MTTVTDVVRCRRARGGNIREPYKHVCEDGFKAEYSRWYSSLPKPMTLKDCESKANTAAWRKTTTCLVFYWYSKIPPGIEKLKGTCFIRDKVVPLGSVHPPPHIVTKHEYPLLNA
jgi:hypothetical protein